MTPEQLAAQLRCPSGDDGAQVADNMNQHNQPIIAASYQALTPSDGDHIVEIGPGTAGHLPDLLAMADDLHYTGLDLSPDMVTQAQQHHSHQYPYTYNPTPHHHHHHPDHTTTIKIIS